MIDTHSHLFVEEFSDDLPLVIQRAKDAGVERVFMPNIDDESLEDMLKVCRHEIVHIAFDQLGNPDETDIFVAQIRDIKIKKNAKMEKI